MKYYFMIYRLVFVFLTFFCLATVLSVHLSFTTSNYQFGMIKLCVVQYTINDCMPDKIDHYEN